MRLRQIALVARDLDPVVDGLCRTLGLEVGFNDPGVAAFGLRNAVIPVGDTFLEVVSPLRENTSAGRFLERRGGDGGYMVMLQTDDLEADRRRLDGLGVRVVWEITLDDIAGVHLHPRDLGGAIVSLDQPRPPESWRWAGPDWRGAV
ncbi:MAG: VOC family protein, partial [Candidatus Binatia bacterium]